MLKVVKGITFSVRAAVRIVKAIVYLLYLFLSDDRKGNSPREAIDSFSSLYVLWRGLIIKMI